MANALYGKAKEGFATGAIDWTGDDIKLALIDDADYTVAINTDQYLSDIPAGARVATSSNFTSKTATLGACDADDVVLTSVTGDPSECIAIYQDTGTASTSRLIAYLDTDTGGAISFTPAGDTLTIRWNAAAIFTL